MANETGKLWQRALASLAPGGRDLPALIAVGLLALTGVVVSSGVLAPDDGARARFVSGEPDPRAYAPVFDLNRAGADELMLVEGVGPALAGQILEFRAKHGPFRRVEDLLDVRGIGPRTLERLARHFRIGRPDSGNASVPGKGQNRLVSGPE